MFEKVQLENKTNITQKL